MRQGDGAVAWTPDRDVCDSCDRATESMGDAAHTRSRCCSDLCDGCGLCVADHNIVPVHKAVIGPVQCHNASTCIVGRDRNSIEHTATQHSDCTGVVGPLTYAVTNRHDTGRFNASIKAFEGATWVPIGPPKIWCVVEHVGRHQCPAWIPTHLPDFTCHQFERNTGTLLQASQIFI